MHKYLQRYSKVYVIYGNATVNIVLHVTAAAACAITYTVPLMEFAVRYALLTFLQSDKAQQCWCSYNKE